MFKKKDERPKKDLNDFNFTTLNTISDDSDDFEINDDLFFQFYQQADEIEASYGEDSSKFSNQLFFHDYFVGEQKIDDTEPDFIFQANYFKSVAILKNSDNRIKLVLNLLNSLSIWFNLGILNFYAYLYVFLNKMKYIFVLSLKILLNIERLLYKFI